MRDSDDRSLSDRELEIAKLVYNGFEYKQIASQLGICVSTVRTHMHQIFLRFGIRGRSSFYKQYRDYVADDIGDMMHARYPGTSRESCRRLVKVVFKCMEEL